MQVVKGGMEAYEANGEIEKPTLPETNREPFAGA